MSPDLETLAARGLAQQRAGQYKAAIQIYRIVLKRGGGDAALLVRLGECFEAVRDPQQADDAYCTAIERDPSFLPAYGRAADLALRARAVAERVGESGAAEELRQAAIRHLVVLNTRLQARGAWGEAEGVLRRLVGIAPADWAAQVDLGRCLLEQGRTAEAESWLRKGLRLAPGQAGAHFHFGQFARRVGRLGEAETAFRQALALDPGLAAAAAALDSLFALKGG